MAFLLCIGLLLPLFSGVVTATEDRAETPYDGNLGRPATVNPMYFTGGTLPISAAPKEERNWAAATPLFDLAEYADLVLVIIDAVVIPREDFSEYWYKVKAADGHTLPEELAEKPWIFQNIVGDDPEYDSLVIDMEAPLVAVDLEESGQGLTWMSYADYQLAQIEAVIENPGLYVGFEAAFDLFWESFQYASNPNESIPGEDENVISSEALTDAQGSAIHVRITGYAVDERGQIWYQIEAAQGYSLPQVLVENPYVLHIDELGIAPFFLVLPQMGMFAGESVEIRKEAVLATRTETIPTSELPLFFEVVPVDIDGNYFDLGDTSGWHDQLAVNGYHYVDASSIILIPPEVTVAYEKMLKADSAKEFDEIWNSLSDSTKALFSDKHMELLDKVQAELNSVTYTGTVTYNGVPLEICVSGPIPKTGVTLSANPLDSSTVLAEGFDVKDATDIITALDIKLLKDDSTEWQPEEGKQIVVSIGVGALGIPDETVVRLHHKHGDEIYVFDVFLVLDGKITVGLNGLSAFAVEAVDVRTQIAGTPTYNDNGIITMVVGDEEKGEMILYNTNAYVRNNYGGGNTILNGTWHVTDTSGAIFYTVHSSSQRNTNNVPGGGLLCVPWIHIYALKETTEATHVKLTYEYRNGNNNYTEDFTLVIEPPAASAGEKYALYLKDDVNTTGRIVATLVDENGQVIADGLDGAAFSWTRSDGALISPYAYGDNNQSVNVAKDHGGLVESRRDPETNEFNPVTYTVNAILSDGTKLDAEYTVYYQSEILNFSFEYPKATTSNYTFFANGWPNLMWKTTAPGANERLTNDIEFGAFGPNLSGTSFGVPQASEGSQFAELNAEAFGALYQDIITAPKEFIEWSFAHAPRPRQNNGVVANNMFIVIGPTEYAQQLDEDDLVDLGDAAKQAAEDLGDTFYQDFEDGKVFVEIEFEGAEYTVWYHTIDTPNNDRDNIYSAANNYGWSDISGSYEVPGSQYRTRLFFVSDPPRNANGTINGNTKNYGNLIDAAKAGQYKDFLIEYYVEKNGKLEHYEAYDEDDDALIYSFVNLQNLSKFLNGEVDRGIYYYLYKIEINGSNYPYALRYGDQAALYIQFYDGDAKDPLDPNEKYPDEDIVMQVYLRDTVVAVQKDLLFPDAMTTEQKLELITSLEKGYQTDFTLTGDGYNAENTATITQRNPKDGSYSAFLSMDDDGSHPPRDVALTFRETGATELPGLVLDKTEYTTTLYYQGVGKTGDPSLDFPEFTLKDEQGSGTIAEIKVTNVYKEKMTTIYYKAIGNGKVALTGMTNFADIPTEQLAFYSGKAVGADIHMREGVIFVGWFKECPEENCQHEGGLIPVTKADGVYDETTGNFKPNANIIHVDEITFYAKFDTPSITINRTNAEPGQTFVYRVSNGKQGTEKIEFYVTVECPDGSGSTTIYEVPAGDYTITEVTDWSWRFHEPEDPSSTAKIDTSNLENLTQEQLKQKIHPSVTFSDDMQNEHWLSDLTEKIARNIFKGGAE